MGIGANLVRRVVDAARATEFATLHLYTTDRSSYYYQLGWAVVERLLYRGHLVTVMSIHIADDV
ncbi:MAG: hypothetical protein HC802_23200 [Caldilineaceae bacterium]|nr:hypothetical protein [Caldilineaceae bacterium]